VGRIGSKKEKEGDGKDSMKERKEREGEGGRL
jgi:hypothetical protein